MSKISIEINAIGVTGDELGKLSKENFIKNVTLKVGNDEIKDLNKNKGTNEEPKKRNDQYDDDIIK